MDSRTSDAKLQELADRLRNSESAEAAALSEELWKESVPRAEKHACLLLRQKSGKILDPDVEGEAKSIAGVAARDAVTSYDPAKSERENAYVMWLLFRVRIQVAERWRTHLSGGFTDAGRTYPALLRGDQSADQNEPSGRTGAFEEYADDKYWERERLGESSRLNPREMVEILGLPPGLLADNELLQLASRGHRAARAKLIQRAEGLNALLESVVDEFALEDPGGRRHLYNVLHPLVPSDVLDRHYVFHMLTKERTEEVVSHVDLTWPDFGPLHTLGRWALWCEYAKVKTTGDRPIP